MEIKEIGRWENQPNVEMYFDNIFRHYILRYNSQIEVRSLANSTSTIFPVEKPLKELLEQRLVQLRLDVSKNLLSMLTDKNEILFCRCSPYKKYKTNADKAKVLGFHFLANSTSECFYFVVTVAGLFLYKMTESSKLKQIKHFQLQVLDYCFEPYHGVIALIGPNCKLSLFYVYQPKGSKAYQGPVFSLEADSNMTKSFNTGPKANNLMRFVTRLDYNQMQLFKIYESLYLVHLENLVGGLYFYQITADKPPEIFGRFKINQGIYGLGLTENLVILQSYNTQETLIYDIQSQIQDYLIKVSHADYIYPSNNRLSAQFSARIDLTSDFFFVSDEITIDFKTCSLKTLEINPAALIDNHPDDVKIILFLLRRDNCKMKVLEKIKESLVSKTPLKRLELIFSTLAAAYRTAKEDRNLDIKRRKLSEYAEHLEMSPSDVDPNIEVKIESGVTVLMQSDIYSCVFAQIYKTTSDHRYFAEALFCFVHFLILNKVQVHFSVQYLLFKVLIKIKDYSKVQRLVENKFFTDSQDIALFLTSLGKSDTIKHFPNCFILGIDMLQRLRLYDVIINELADQEYYYEGLYISKTQNTGEALAQEIMKKCEFD